MKRLHLTQGIIIGVALGLAIGVGAYTFVYAQGYSLVGLNFSKALSDVDRFEENIEAR